MDKKHWMLVILVLVLTIILSFQLYIIFVKKPSTTSTQKIVEKTALDKNMSNLFIERPEAQVQNILKGITQKVDSVKPVLRSGVLKQLELTETYKSVIIKNGKTNTERELVDGSVSKADYVLSFASMAEDGKKEHGFVFPSDFVDEIEVYALQGNEEIPISLESIQPGDYVSVTITTDVLLRPEDPLLQFKIVKLL